ncbi:MAG: hypothetical protein AAFQ51_05385 [Pseudomonadota bacterium]
MELHLYTNSHPHVARTDAEWGAYFGISAVYFSQIRNGNRRPSIEVAMRIVERTGHQVTLYDIFRNEAIKAEQEEHERQRSMGSANTKRRPATGDGGDIVAA